MSDSVIVDSPRVSLPRGDWMAWLVCLSAGLFFLYEFFQLNLFDVINASLRHDFQMDAEQISWMSSTYLWADILFLLPAGVILDRCSARSVILTALLICIIGTIGFALSHSFRAASWFHFLSGIGNAFCFLSCVVLASRWFPPQKRALVIGCVVTMAFIGGMMAHTPLAYLNDHYGWRHSLMIDGFVGVLFFIWIFIVVKDEPKSSVISAGPSSPQRYDFFRALTNPQNWLAGIYTSCLNLPIMVLCALWGANYLQTTHQLPELTASNVVSMIFLGSIVGCPLVGWASDRSGRRKPLMILGAVATLFTLLPLFMSLRLSEFSLSLLFFLLGFFSSTQVISYPLISESNARGNIGAATGMASVIIMGGAGVAQVLFGMLIHHHAVSEVYTAADFKFAMLMFPIAAVAALFAILLTRETFCKPVDVH